MGILQDLYIRQLAQKGNIQNPPLAIPQQSQVGQQPQQQEIPQVDTSNAIQSIAQLMGPTPAEREAQERKLLENKRKMIAWTGLFDGLRHLGNLYYASQGATPQQYTDKPYQQIEQNYQQERNLQEYLNRYSQAYAKQLFDLQRQGEQDKMRKEAHEAQMKYYENRDEQNARKMDLAEFKAKTDADYKKATLDQKNAINEVRIRLLEGQISKTEADRQYKLIMMGNAQAGTRTTTTKSDGTVTTVVKEPNRKTSKGSSGRRGSLLPREKGNNTQRKGSLLPK